MSILKLLNKYPQLNKTNISEINIECYNNAKEFILDDKNLLSCFAIDFYTKKQNDNDLFIDGLNINNILKDLLEEKKPNIDCAKAEHKNALIIYLCYIKALIKDNQKIANETAKYALNILNDLDNNLLKQNICDKLFKITNPLEFNKLSSLILEKQSLEQYLKLENELLNKIDLSLKDSNINHEISSRIKSIYSLHQKINNKNLALKQINDFLGIRIILDNIQDCYDTLSNLAKFFNLQIDKTKDYISYPKENGYQSLHLIIDSNSQPIEVQIRTKKMHQQCEFGSASHQKYKQQFLS